MGGRGDRDDVIEVVVGRIVRIEIVVGSRVAGSGNEQGIVGGRDCVVEGLRKTAASPTVIRDPHAHCSGIFDRADRIERASRTAVAEELQCHQLGVPVDPHHPLAVVARRSDRAGDVGSVGVNVHRIAIVIGEVIAVDIVDVAVAVVIDVVAGDFARVGPDVGDQIGVRVVDAGIDNADHDATTSLNIPGLDCIDVGIHCSAALSGVMQSPELAEL